MERSPFGIPIQLYRTARLRAAEIWGIHAKSKTRLQQRNPPLESMWDHASIYTLPVSSAPCWIFLLLWMTNGIDTTSTHFLTLRTFFYKNFICILKQNLLEVDKWNLAGLSVFRYRWSDRIFRSLQQFLNFLHLFRLMYGPGFIICPPLSRPYFCQILIRLGIQVYIIKTSDEFEYEWYLCILRRWSCI